MALCVILFSSTTHGAGSFSGGPLEFDNFTVVDGNITTDCPPIMKGSVVVAIPTCGEPILSDGMLQREVIVPAGPDLENKYEGTYIQYIITEPGTTGDAAAAPFSDARGNLNFSNQDFVKMRTRGSGIASKLTIIDSQFDAPSLIEDRMIYDVTYNYGWAQGDSGNVDPWVDIHQDISRLQYSPDRLSAIELSNSTANIISVGPGGTINNTSVDFEQRMQFSPNLGSDVQKFKYTRLTGSFQMSGSDVVEATPDKYLEWNGTAVVEVAFCVVGPSCLFVPGSPGINANPILPGGTNGGQMTWGVGEGLKALWIGFSSVEANNTVFGLTRYENFTSGGVDNNTQLVSLDDANAANWNNILELSNFTPLFGAAELITSIFTPMATAAVFDPTINDKTLRTDLFVANTGATPPPVIGNIVFEPIYDQWRVDNGVFTVDGLLDLPCPVEASFCAEPIVNGDGMYQRLIMVAGETYYQVIIVEDGSVTGDPNAAVFEAGSLAFKTETYIKATNGDASTGSGIASKQHIATSGDNAYLLQASETSGNNPIPLPFDAGSLVSDTTMNIGWANNGGLDPTMSLSQTIEVQNYIAQESSSMETHFAMDIGATENDRFISLSSRVGSQNGYINPIQLHTVTVQGDFQNTARVAINDPFDPGYDPLLPGSGEDLGWVEGDALKATWLGAQYGTNPAISVEEISTTSFTNLTTGDKIAHTVVEHPATLQDPAPDNWLVDPFGAAPIYTRD